MTDGRDIIHEMIVDAQEKGRLEGYRQGVEDAANSINPMLESLISRQCARQKIRSLLDNPVPQPAKPTVVEAAKVLFDMFDDNSDTPMRLHAEFWQAFFKAASKGIDPDGVYKGLIGGLRALAGQEGW